MEVTIIKGKQTDWKSKENVIVFCQMVSKERKASVLLKMLQEYNDGKFVGTQQMLNCWNNLCDILGIENTRERGKYYLNQDIQTALDLIELYFEKKLEVQNNIGKINTQEDYVTKSGVEKVENILVKRGRKLGGKNKPKVIDENKIITEKKVLTRITDNDKKLLRFRIYNIIGFKDNYSVTFEDIRSIYFHKYNQPLHRNTLEKYLNEFKEVLPANCLRHAVNSYRIINYMDGLEVIAPDRCKINIVLEVPNHITISEYFNNFSGSVNELREYDSCSLYEIIQPNSRKNFRYLIRLVIAGCKIIMPSNKAEEIKHQIDALINSVEEVFE